MDKTKVSIFVTETCIVTPEGLQYMCFVTNIENIAVLPGGIQLMFSLRNKKY